MYCHMCILDFDTFEDFKDHILTFHKDPTTWNAKPKSQGSDHLCETPTIDIKDEIIIGDSIDIKDEIIIGDSIDIKDEIIIEDSIDIKDENVLNTSEKDCDSDHSTVEENKSSDSRTSFNTLTEKSYVSNQNMAANIVQEKCHKDTSPKKLKQCNIIKNKLVSNSTELTKLPKKYEPSLVLKNYKQKSKEPLKDFPRKRKSASYQKNVYENSSADATEQPNSLIGKSNHLNSQSPFNQNSSDLESVSTNCLPMFDNKEFSDSSVHGMAIKNKSPFVLLNTIPEKYHNILDNSLKKFKNLDESKPVSNSNRLLKSCGTLSVFKKQVKKKKVSNLKKVYKLRKPVSHQKGICDPTEVNQANQSKNSFNEDNSSDLLTSVVNFQSNTNNILNGSLRSLEPHAVKNETVSKKRVLKRKKTVSFSLPKYKKSASYQRVIHDYIDANRADQSKSSFNEDNHPHISTVNFQSTTNDVSNASFRKPRNCINKIKPISDSLPKKGRTFLKKGALRKRKSTLSNLENLPKHKKYPSCQEDIHEYTDNNRADQSNKSLFDEDINSHLHTSTVNSHPTTIISLQKLQHHIDETYQNTSDPVLNFIATHSTEFKGLTGFPFTSKAILNWLGDFKKMCKNVQYPLPQSLYNAVAIAHTGVFNIHSSVGKERSAVLKVYKELNSMIFKHVRSVHNNLTN